MSEEMNEITVNLDKYMINMYDAKRLIDVMRQDINQKVFKD